MSPNDTNNDYVRIFDTTLRDGEQAPGNSMNLQEKLRIAKTLARLNVDIIEAGFPASSPGDFESVQMIAKTISGPTICGLARAVDGDIDTTAKAVEVAERSRIHTFIATSEIHMEHKLRMTPEQVLEAAKRAVSRARSQIDDIEFSCEDATRSDWNFLVKVFQAAIDAGATTLNVPDTVGYTIPEEYTKLITFLRQELQFGDDVVFSVHCHNDLGVAVANSLAGVQAGARQIECTINGIGERAGNTALEEVVMALRTRKAHYGIETRIDTKQLYPASRLLTQVTGSVVQANKAIVGANAFAHEAGIHQAGVLNNALTYEIIQPEDVGVTTNKLVLGKHSGRHAVSARLKELGFSLDQEQLDKAFRRFKELADSKKEIYDEDLEAIVADEVVRVPSKYALVSVNVASGTQLHPHATIGIQVADETILADASGDGPVDAALNALRKATGSDSKLTAYVVNAISGGTDAQGEVTVQVEDAGVKVRGQGAHTDIVIASARAYVNALNKLEHRKMPHQLRKAAGGP